MSIRINRHICFLIIASLPVLVLASSIRKQNSRMIDSLETRLEELNNPYDSVQTLLNIYDIGASYKQRYDALERLNHTTKLRGMHDTRIDVLTYAANEMRDNDSLLNIIEKNLNEIPESPRQKEALLFLEMIKIDAKIKTHTRDLNTQHLSDLIKTLESDTDLDPYEEALMLYSLCMHLSKTTKGGLLEEYIGKLLDHINSMNLPAGKVRNLVYTRATPIYARNGSAESAVAMDKDMLNIIDSLSLAYKSQGRPYRNMDTYRYSVYRRMLINYRALKPEEIEFFYKKSKEISGVNVRVSDDIRHNEIIEVCYLLANKKYREAIPVLKKHLHEKFYDNYRAHFLNELVKAAAATGDRATQLEAALELNDSLTARIDSRADERYRELQIVYDMAELRKANSDLRMDEHQAHLRMTRIVLGVLAVMLLLLIAFIIVLLRNYRTYKVLADKLLQTSERLRDERNELRKTQTELIAARDKAKDADKLKTEFINNMSHEVKAPLDAVLEYSQLIMDCIPPDKQKYLEGYAKSMKQNTKVIMTLLNDVLDMASLEHGNIAVHKKPVSIQEICHLALDNIFEGRKRSGIKIVFNPGNKPDDLASTDQVRVCQVLMNLLSNADKFTQEGTITLDYDIDRKNNKVIFYVSDTGTGIPDGCEELILDRFYKADSSMRGCGLGLYIARLLAGLMQGEVKLDTDYHNGARFIFTIPL